MKKSEDNLDKSGKVRISALLVNWHLLIIFCAGYEREDGRKYQDPGPCVRADQLFRDILETITFFRFQAVIQDAAPVQTLLLSCL